MFFVLPIWPKTDRTPWFTITLILVQTAVFLAVWPAEKRRGHAVDKADLVQSSQALADLLKSADQLVTPREKSLLVNAGDPTPALAGFYASVNSRAGVLPGRLQDEWHAAYPRFNAQWQSIQTMGEQSSPYRIYGLRKNRSLWPGILTHQFLHAGWLHLLGNMLFLWAIGGLAEERLGMGLIPFFLAGGAAAALVQLWLGVADQAVMVGASGAVSAMMGFGMAAMALARTRVFYLLAPFLSVRYGTFDSPLWFFLPLWLFEQVLMAMMAHSKEWVTVAYGAHLGGFAFGAAAGAASMVMVGKK